MGDASVKGGTRIAPGWLFPLRDLNARAQRVIEGTQSGTYTKHQMARDLLRLSALVQAHRREYLMTSRELHPTSDAWAEESLADFERDVQIEAIEADEMVCDRCGQRHGVVWSVPSDVWNAVMRDGDRANPDTYGFCCPTCFMQLADDRQVGVGMWVIAPDPLRGPYGTTEKLVGRAE